MAEGGIAPMNGNQKFRTTQRVKTKDLGCMERWMMESRGPRNIIQTWLNCSYLHPSQAPPRAGLAIVSQHRKVRASQLRRFILWAIKLNTVIEPMNSTAL